MNLRTNRGSLPALTLALLGTACDRGVLHPGTYVPPTTVAPPVPEPVHPDGTCDPGLVACGGSGAGYCFDLRAAPDHCGACGNACAPGIPCQDGQCRVAPCASQLTVKVLWVDNSRAMRYQVGVADFDRDGALDIVIPTWDPTTAAPEIANATVYRGQGDGSFAPAASFPAGRGSPYWDFAFAAADLNRDQIPDLVIDSKTAAMTVHLGNGDGTFGPGMDVAGGAAPGFITVADLDGDAAPDLATVAPPNQAVTVRRGNGDGTFASPQDLEVGGTPGWVLVTDWNADGIPDLLAADDYVHVLLGNGHGAFAPALDCALSLSRMMSSSNGQNVPPLLGDFDHDGRVDLVANSTLMLGMEDCNFSRETTFHVSYDAAYPVAVADFNGDGNADLAVAFWEGVGYLAGDGHGNLGDLVYLGDLGAEGLQPDLTTGQAGDFNGDGRLDLLVANQYSVRVFMNTCK